jgi:hypothetical protein
MDEDRKSFRLRPERLNPVRIGNLVLFSHKKIWLASGGSRFHSDRSQELPGFSRWIGGRKKNIVRTQLYGYCPKSPASTERACRLTNEAVTPKDRLPIAPEYPNFLTATWQNHIRTAITERLRSSPLTFFSSGLFSFDMSFLLAGGFQDVPYRPIDTPA